MLVGMYNEGVRQEALRLLSDGLTLSQTSRTLAVSRAALRDWRSGIPRKGRRLDCPRCVDASLHGRSYAALLGFYLGDGCISRAARYFALRVSCDASYPRIVEDVALRISQVRPGGNIWRVSAPGVVVVQSNWKHWPCLFPQHGPGRKHERTIALEAWQREIVEEYPADFLRGLFHSDGSRVANWATREVRGVRKRYDYPRWQFTNHSPDIRDLCCWALDLLDIPWRQSNWKTISVSRRDAVARLDDLVGLKA
jgi:hypothetical protein